MTEQDAIVFIEALESDEYTDRKVCIAGLTIMLWGNGNNVTKFENFHRAFISLDDPFDPPIVEGKSYRNLVEAFLSGESLRTLAVYVRENYRWL